MIQKTVTDAEAQYIGEILDVPVAETTQLCGESGHNEMSRPNPTPRVLGRGCVCRIVAR